MEYAVIECEEEAKNGVCDMEQKVDVGNNQGGVSPSDSGGDIVNSECVKYDIADVEKGNAILFCNIMLKSNFMLFLKMHSNQS